MTLIGLAGYFCVVIGVSWWYSRGQDFAGFVIGNRQITGFQAALSYGAGFRDAAFFSFWLMMGYLFGYAILLLYVGLQIGLWIVGRVAPRLREEAHQEGYITPTQMIGKNVGSYSKIMTSLVILATNISIITAQFYVIGRILAATTGMDPVWVIPLVALVIAVYLWIGGYISVVRTDVVQAGIMLSLLVLPFTFFSLDMTDALDWQSFGALGWQESLAVLVLGIIGASGNADLWQRIFSVKSAKAAQQTAWWGGSAALLLTLALLLIGISLRHMLPNYNPAELFTAIFTLQEIPTYILAWLLVAVLAMGMSTTDTHAYLFSSIILRDILKYDPSKSRQRYVWLTRALVAVLLSLAALLALKVSSLMDVLMGVVNIYNIPTALYLISALRLVPHPPWWFDGALTITTLISLAVLIYMFVEGYLSQSFTMAIVPSVLAMVLAGVVVIAARITRRT